MRAKLQREPFDYASVTRSNEEWPDHRLRTLVTASMIAWLKPESILDPACGDASIITRAVSLLGIGTIKHIYLNDVSEAQTEFLKGASGLRLAGASFANLPVEALLSQLRIGKPVDVIVLTEILEHLEDPDEILRLAAECATYLVASSPEMRPGQLDHNPEHLWMFDGPGYEQMLNEAGWKVLQKTHLTFRSDYDFGIYVAEKP